MSERPETMSQVAPYPHDLRDLVEALNGNYKPGYLVSLYDDYARDEVDGETVGRGMTLSIVASVPDSVGNVYPKYGGEPGEMIQRGDTIRVNHMFIVPAATYTRDSWKRWLLNRCIDVETHEVCEFFYIDGERPFAPHHGNGEDPYTIWHHGTEDQRQKRAGVA